MAIPTRRRRLRRAKFRKRIAILERRRLRRAKFAGREAISKRRRRLRRANFGRRMANEGKTENAIDFLESIDRHVGMEVKGG